MIVLAPVAASEYDTSTEALVSKLSERLQQAALQSSAPAIVVVCTAVTRLFTVEAARPVRVTVSSSTDSCCIVNSIALVMSNLEISIVSGLYPTYVTTSKSDWLVVDIENLPSRSVITPLSVPAQRRVAPIKGSPFSSFIVPNRLTTSGTALVTAEVTTAVSELLSVNTLLSAAEIKFTDKNREKHISAKEIIVDFIFI